MYRLSLDLASLKNTDRTSCALSIGPSLGCISAWTSEENRCRGNSSFTPPIIASMSFWSWLKGINWPPEMCANAMKKSQYGTISDSRPRRNELRPCHHDGFPHYIIIKRSLSTSIVGRVQAVLWSVRNQHSNLHSRRSSRELVGFVKRVSNGFCYIAATTCFGCVKPRFHGWKVRSESVRPLVTRSIIFSKKVMLWTHKS